MKALKLVVIRTQNAGVFYGSLVKRSGSEATLNKCRRLWYWKPAKGAFLSGVAAYGLHKDSKVGVPVNIALTEDCEIIHVKEEAAQSIKGAPDYEPK